MIELQNETPQEWAERLTQRDDFHVLNVEAVEQCVRRFPGHIQNQWAAYRELTKSKIQLSSFTSKCYWAWKTGGANFVLQFSPR